MLIQHILTEEIFNQVFDNSDFHHNNNVAKELYALEGTFFTGGVRRETVERLKPYYAAIKRAATSVPSHQEKQKFFKVIYENFYKVYNRKAADRLGVAYTPNEIVRFMIESADWLCEKHFNKRLIDKDVEILDPATGTGTFIVDLLEHFRGQKEKLRHKYLEELHANEVAILPYYVANLNIEATYAAITGEYLEYPNLCFVDTLDNVAGLHAYGVGRGQHYGDLLGAIAEENIARIKRQNRRKISVVIGNPPWNANQLNENENNKNREYPTIDRRIKETYIAASTAQKTKLYDMYARFVRWASDRIEENGIVAFVSNSSFVQGRAFDGFRKIVAEEFNDLWVIDLKGNARSSGDRRRREGGNIFENKIRVGVAIYFLVKSRSLKDCHIHYQSVPDYAKADEKTIFITSQRMDERLFVEIKPDVENSWLGQTHNDFGALLPMGNKETKSAKRAVEECAIFKLFSLGVVTARDEWVYGNSTKEVQSQVGALITNYNRDLKKIISNPKRKDLSDKQLADLLSTDVKWTRAVKKDLRAGLRYTFDGKYIVSAMYRPFVRKRLYFDQRLNEMQYQLRDIFGLTHKNEVVLIDVSGKPFSAFSVNLIPDYHLNGDSICFSRYSYKQKNRRDNITDWALDQFRFHYEKSKKPKCEITKDAIFHYVYGVLHDPIYREKYALNLKRGLPRIPLYSDFWKWAEWGEKLMALHIGYEKVEPWKLKRVDAVDKTAKKSGIAPKAMLKALKDTGGIQLDSDTLLTGVPKEAWDYRLGNRSALEWVLDQYKEKSPKDPTIREKFNTYCFAGYKDHVIDLLGRVIRVSVETMTIIKEMKAAKNVR